VKTRSLTHWGLYDFHTESNRITRVEPHPNDTDPSPIGQNLIDGNALNRVAKPAVRKGYLEGNRSSIRGQDEYVDVEWEDAISLVASELERVRTTFGNEAIYGGSYGWASAGRFHHALSQVHRFLNCMGGYTRSVNSYSFAAAEVILPHIVGDYEALLKAPTSWDSIAENTGIMLCFGGLPLRNGQITNGGMSKHTQKGHMFKAKSAGVSFVNISPSKRDCEDFLEADWIPIRPGTDTALLLALAHETFIHNRHDEAFLEKCTTGLDDLAAYLTGGQDGVAKSSEWAANITGISANRIRDLAKAISTHRVMISLSWSLSRHQHGEQTYWMGIALAAMLGQIGLPGGGVGLGYSAENKVGKNVSKRKFAALPQGTNDVSCFIPVARIADMLLHPGEEYRYDGRVLNYPSTKLIYWAGGNPFHHHQDLNRLQRAWQKPDTIICHELVWNATAKHADIVLPVASSLERNDLGGAPNEDVLVAMKQVLPPYGVSKSDFEIFTLLSRALGVEEVFTLGMNEENWIRHLFDQTRKHHCELPEFEQFWKDGEFHFADPPAHNLFEKFRTHPTKYPLDTASGRIQISLSPRQHPRWEAPTEWLGRPGDFPFSLVSHQPATRLHSQLDHGSYSQSQKIKGLEVLYIHPENAAARGLKDDDIVKVFNNRGAFLAGTVIDEGQMKNVLHIATGAWWQPDADGTCHAGNPNAVTADVGTSDIAQGPSALSCLVDIERVDVKQTPKEDSA
jgi:biotin/methionine sulfoxide reductase